MARGSKKEGAGAPLVGADLKDAMKRLPKGSMHFAFGLDGSRQPVMLMHKTRSARALRNDLKTKLGVKQAAHGRASAEGKVLKLEVEGPPLPTMEKAVKVLLRKEKIDKFNKAEVHQVDEGGARGEAQEESPQIVELRALKTAIQAMENRVTTVLKDLATGATSDTSLIEDFGERCLDFAKTARGCGDQELLAFARDCVARAKKMSAFVARATGTGATVTGAAATTGTSAKQQQQQPATPPPAPAPPPSNLSGSVGKGGRNKPDDTKVVQELLNKHGASLGVDGLVGPKTIGAIAKFQKKNLGFADGRVDPGGRTWQALIGGAGSGAGAGAGGAQVPAGAGGAGGAGGTDSPGDGKDGPSKPPPRATFEDTFEDPDRKPLPPKEKKGTGGGTWFDAETEISTPFGSVKVQTDANGNVTGGALVVPIFPNFSFRENFFGPYYVGASIKTLERETSFKGTGPRFPITGKIGCGGAGILGFGGAKRGFTIGIEGEISLSLSMVTFKAMIDVDTLEFSYSGITFPIEIPLSGAVKVIASATYKDYGPKHSIPLRDYPGIVIATIKSDWSISVRFGPGKDKLVADYQALIDIVKNADPEMIGTGATPLTPEEREKLGGEGEQAKKAEKVGMGAWGDQAADAVKKLEIEAALTEARSADAAMRSAYNQGWQNPQLLSKANALAQKDEARAREYYGNAWTQRALAKQAYDKYSPPNESTPLNIITVRTGQAHDIANKFLTAVGLFQQGDSRW